jgi:hypothetical protein
MKKLMLFITPAVLALVVMPANIQAQRVHPKVDSGTSTGNRVATHLAVGGGWTTTMLLINLGVSPATYTLAVAFLFGRSHGRGSCVFDQPLCCAA